MKTTKTQSKTRSNPLLTFGRTRLAGSVVLPLFLAFALTACQDTQVDELETIDEMNSVQDGYGTTGSSDRIVAVSITGGGELVPSVPAGRATFHVNNEGQEDCELTLIPSSSMGMTPSGDLGQRGAGEDGMDALDGQTVPPDNSDLGADQMEDGATDTDPYAESDPAGAADGQSAYQGTGSGNGEQIAQAGEATTISMDLQPGLYEVACEGNGEMGGTQTTADASPMKVMVTEDTGSMGMGLDEPLDGGMDQEGMDADTGAVDGF